ncbi:hypothetical protein QUF80_09810 [Desulfococcaceae bacterium HSG8]|nr:hypothetical protein [Desulfococcaceae bacterium HSG8]
MKDARDNMNPHHASRITYHVSRFTFHVSRFMHHASRITHHASRFTHHAFAHHFPAYLALYIFTSSSVTSMVLG